MNHLMRPSDVMKRCLVALVYL